MTREWDSDSRRERLFSRCAKLELVVCCIGDCKIRGGRGILPYTRYIGMCRREGYGFQAVHSGIGYINQSVWVWNRVSCFTKLGKPGIATQKI